MGGLRRKMPVTCWTFFVGVLAISGAGIAGTHIGLGGFFSKDEILAVAYARSFAWDDYDKQEIHHGEPGERPAHHAQSAPAQTTGGRTARAILVSEPVSGSAGDRTAATSHGRSGDRASIFSRMPPLPGWMFCLALFTAYVTPFYMMRCWWLTFMGKPRDEHVHEHAHETALMYIPLVVLAVGTVVASYFLFRPLISDASSAASAASMVLATDGHVHTPAIEAADRFLMVGGGGAFLVGFAVAIAIYGRGLATASSIKRALWPIHTLLEHKYYFDEVYNLVWVRGCVMVARIARLLDTYLVDLFFNMLATVTTWLAAFSGLILDDQGVDGVVHGIAKSSKDLGDVMRRPQTGRIRHYLLLATGAAAVVILCFAVWGSGPAVGSTG